MPPNQLAPCRSCQQAPLFYAEYQQFMSLHYLTLTEQQINDIRAFLEPRGHNFDQEQVEFVGEFALEDESFDHEYGTEQVFTPVLTHLEIKIWEDNWVTLIEDGEDKEELITLSERQYEKCLASLRGKNVY